MQALWQRLPGVVLGSALCFFTACGGGTAHSPEPDAGPSPDAAPADATLADAAPADATPDGCVPAACDPEQCGAPADGCGGVLACGDCEALGETCGGAGQPNVCGAPYLILWAEPGCFHTVSDINDQWSTVVGGSATYAWIRISYETVHGGWRTDLYSREVLAHNLLAFRRNAPTFVGRYILGNGVQIRPAHATLDRRSVFYGRVDLEEKPPGLGYTGYTAWRDPYPFQPGETYGFDILLDAVGQQQTLELYHGGQLELTQVGDIPYFDPSLTAIDWTVEFGGEETDHRDVVPLGWQFCNLLVEAEEL